MRLILFFIALSLNAVAQVNYPAYATTANSRNSEGDLIYLNDSTILLGYTQYYNGVFDFSGSQIYSKISNDNGNTWQNHGILQPNAGLQTTRSMSFLRLPNNDILLFYMVGNSLTDLKVYVRRSVDNAETFGSPVLVTDTAGYWVLNNARVFLSTSGRIIVPVAYTPNAAQSGGTNPTYSIKSRVIYSDDNGATWTRGSQWLTAPQRGAMEPGIVELSPGNLLMYLRTQMGVQYYSESSDDGLTWTDAHPSTLVSPEAPATIINHNDTLIAIHNDNGLTAARTPLTISISTDDGATWVKVKDIEDRSDHSFAYTSAVIRGGHLVLSYWDSVNNNASISLKFREILLTELFDE